MDRYSMTTPYNAYVSDAKASATATHKTFFDKHHSASAIEFTIFTALALYNVLEISILIFSTFRRFAGLYFWSMVVATLGLFLYTFGTMVEYYNFASELSGLIIRAIGWPAMITGQSFVLYSRLSVMFMGEYQGVQRAMWWTIVVDAVVNHTVTIILTFGNAYAHPHFTWSRAFNIQHKFGRTCFTIQECILSGLYIWRAVTFLRNSVILNDRKRVVLVMWQLIAINLIIEGLDVYVLVEEFLANHPVRQMVKALVYSIKLKLEFAVLSQLVDITTESRSNYASYSKDSYRSNKSARHSKADTEFKIGGARDSVNTVEGEDAPTTFTATRDYAEDPLTFHPVNEHE